MHASHLQDVGDTLFCKKLGIGLSLSRSKPNPRSSFNRWCVGSLCNRLVSALKDLLFIRIALGLIKAPARLRHCRKTGSCKRRVFR